MLFATCSGRVAFPFTSWAHVSESYRATIERLGLGASQAPPCRIVNEAGQCVAHVSYNGRVWPGERFETGATPIYDPRA